MAAVAKIAHNADLPSTLLNNHTPTINAVIINKVTPAPNAASFVRSPIGINISLVIKAMPKYIIARDAVASIPYKIFCFFTLFNNYTPKINAPVINIVTAAPNIASPRCLPIGMRISLVIRAMPI